MKKFINIFRIVLEIVLVIITVLSITGFLKVARVNGRSMNPTLNDGDILVVCALEPEDKDVVILTTEGKESKAEYIVKRYYEEKSDSTGYWVEGDNKENSLDSRKLGRFSKDNLRGVAVFDISQFRTLK